MRKITPFILALACFAHPAFAQDGATKNSLVIVACRVDDLTGKPGRHGVDPVTGEFNPESAARGWRDLELHVENGELECKVVPYLNLEDSAMYSKFSDASLIPLDPNFVDWAQCAHAGMMIGPDWEQQNKGWGVVAVGCPTPIMNTGPDGIKGTEDDYQIGLKLPECPTYYPGKFDPKHPEDNRMKCRFTPSMI